MRPAELRMWVVMHLGLLVAIASRLGVAVWFLLLVSLTTFAFLLGELVTARRSKGDS